MLTTEQSIVVAVFFILEILTVVPLNVILIIGICKNKLTDSITWKNITLLGFSGCFLGLFVIPINVILFTAKKWTRWCRMEYAAIFIGQTNCQFTVYIIFLLALHRYFMTRPRKKGRRKILQRLTKSSTQIWMVVFVMSLLHGAASVDFFGMISSSVPNILMKIIDVSLGLIIFIIYLRLYIQIKKYARNFRVTFADSDIKLSQPRPKRMITPKYVKETAITIALILLVLAVCYIPFLVMDIWTSWYTFLQSRQAPKNIRFAYYLTYGSVFFVSIGNAVVIIYRNRDLKLFCKRILFNDGCLHDNVSTSDTLTRVVDRGKRI